MGCVGLDAFTYQLSMLLRAATGKLTMDHMADPIKFAQYDTLKFKNEILSTCGLQRMNLN